MMRNEDYLEGLAQRIGQDFEEDDATYKKLNIEKLLKSDFIDRFLGFVEAYDEVFDKNIFHTIIKEYPKYYDYIKYFLATSPLEYFLPFCMEDFINMTFEDFITYQEKCVKICALLDEKRALYEEFNTFYE